LGRFARSRLRRRRVSRSGAADIKFGARIWIVIVPSACSVPPCTGVGTTGLLAAGNIFASIWRIGYYYQQLGRTSATICTGVNGHAVLLSCFGNLLCNHDEFRRGQGRGGWAGRPACIRRPREPVFDGSSAGGHESNRRAIEGRGRENARGRRTLRV